MDTQWIVIISLIILVAVLLLLLLRFLLPKPTLNYRILGRVLNQATRQGVAGLRVEAWDKDLIVNDRLGTAVTDTTGRFQITFTSSQFQAWFGNLRPDLFFKVFRDNDLIKSTEDSILWNIPAGDTEVIIEVDIPEEKPDIPHTLPGQLLNQETNAPLPGFIVQAFDLDAGPDPKPLGSVTTDNEGRFTLTYTTPAPPEPPPPPAQRRLRLHVLTPQVEEIYQTEIVVQIDQTEPVILRVVVPRLPSHYTFTDLEEALQIQFPATLLAFLANHNITTLDQIRRMGGISQLEGIPDDPAVPMLEAHAYLSLLSPDVHLNAKLINKGYSSMATIASTPRSTFVAHLKDDLPTLQAESLYQQAVLQMNSFGNILTNLRADLANGWYWGGSAFWKWLWEHLGNLFPQVCGCPDRQSAVSPVAYLADLLQYTMTHVVKPGNVPVSLTDLESQLHQPFSQYPVAYEQVERKVRQVRIGIEVLRKYLQAQDGEIDRVAYQTYLFEAYRTLLNQIGTSYDAIRLVNTASPKERQLLGDRLGVRSEHLEQLYLTPETITEQRLEHLFGLVDTNHDPLWGTPKLGDEHNQIRQWDFTGITWNQNIDSDGYVYVNLNMEPNSWWLIFTIYRDKSKTELIASGRVKLLYPANTPPEERGDYTVNVSEENGSGLSGTLQGKYICNDDIALFLLPELLTPKLLSWRLEYLRDLWKQQDWPADSYQQNPDDTYTESKLLPVIDPDVIGPDDFREPLAKGEDTAPDSPFDLWCKRRGWVDFQLNDLRLQRKEGDLRAVLERMRAPILYSYRDRDGNLHEYNQAPWLFPPIENLISELQRLSKNLERGQDLESTQQSIQTELKLTTESFKRLMQIIAKSDLTPTQESAIPEDEWEELFSILVQAQKVSLFPTWIAEEGTLENGLPPETDNPLRPVLFSPKYFWISLRPPLEGDWPPAPDCPARLPLIDPELGTLETLGELPAPLTGKFAAILWERRQVRLEEIKAALALIGVSGFEAKMKWAVGHPNQGDDLNLTPPNNLSDSYSNLDDLERALDSLEADAIAVIHQNLYLTVPGFKRLMEIKAIAEPTPDQWDEVHRLLTTAQKLKREYPDWRTVENAVPILDPDLLKLTDLPEPTAGKLALTLWQTRRDQIDRTYESLQTTRETDGFGAMLAEALDPLPGGSVSTWSDYLDAQQNALNSGDDTRVREARWAIATILCMTVEDFNHLMEIKAKSEAANPQNQPTQPEWAEVYTILTQSYKFKQCYPNWLEEEASLDYWQKLKAKLPRWRATPETRALWQRALRLRSQSALIDPDVIGDEDLKTLVEGDPAYDILRSRQQWSDAQTSNLKNIRENNSDGGLGAIVRATLGVPLQELLDLVKERDQGNDISPRLDQLSLSIDDFQTLIRADKLLSSGIEITDSEWEVVYWSLVQARKRRVFAEWRNQEQTSNIILSPDFFQIPDEEPERWQQSPLAILLTRRDWQDQLNARMDQEKATLTALNTAVDACEEATLTLLRDALINAAEVPESALASKAKYLTEQLLIDCQTGSCQKTTRIAQAITTLQTLIFSLRTGQLEDLPFSLIDDEQFDEEWQWIGSYETWKAAMGVFLYPENILLPSLRRQKTPAFRELVEALRTNQRLTPQGARDLAKSYETYFNDVCGLTVQATCTAETRIKRDVDKRPLFYMFGLGGVTGRVYWSAYDPASENAGYAQTFWEEVPGLENVTQIIGAVPYEIAEGTSFIYLFTLTQVKGATQLGFIKYDLENPKPQRWESPPTTLEDLPESATQFTALVKQRNRTDDPPHLLIRLLSPGHRVYARYLNQEATDWAEGEWKPLLGRCIGRRITKIYAMVEIQPENFCLIASFLLSERPTGPTSIAQDSVSLATIPEAKLQIRDGVNFNQKSPDFNRRLVNYRIFGKVDDGTWREVFDGDFDFAGTFEIKETLCTFFSSQASKSSDNNNYWFKSLKAGKLYTPDSPTVGRINLDRLNDWLSEVNALDLRNVIINLKDIYQAEEDSFVNLYIFLNTERSVDTLYKVIDWFADQIDNAEYTDKTWGDWKVASDWIPQLSIPSVFDLRQALKLLFAATNYQFKYRHVDALSSEYRTEKDRIIAPTWGKFSSNSIYVAYTFDQQRYEFYRGKFIVPVTNPPNIVVIEDLVIASFVKPQLRYYLSISEQLSTSELQIRRSWIATVFDNNGLQDSSETNEIQPPFSLSNLTYLEDAFYFVPAAPGLIHCTSSKRASMSCATRRCALVIEVWPCKRNKLIAQLRIKPQFAGAWPCFKGHSSSLNTTSLTQCSRFSMPQCP